jgi:hypothetical protein
MDTATSNVRRTTWVRASIQVKFLLTEAVRLPRRVRSKCPAIMLADRRTASVPGRIIFLIDSIRTINDIRADGVPWGTRWANMWFEKFTHPNSMKESHMGKAREKVTTICLVPVNMYGKSPIKLLMRIKMRREQKIKILPG